MTEPAAERATRHFLTHRNLLFTVAYEVLGSAADAEDVLQETWLRWVGVDLEQVEEPRAYLIRITTRQALNRLRTLSRRRETYVGPWLPEPLLTTPDVAEDVELAESVSMALLLLLETLSPTERAVFVLREAFGFDYAEIAEAVEKSPAAVRQIAHRARHHVHARRPRQATSPAEARAAVESFQHALQTGDLQHLVDVLAPEVVCIADGGGVRTAARRPIVGAQRVLAYVHGVSAKAAGTIATTLTSINGSPALIAYVGGELDGVVSIAVHEGQITGIYYVRNPEKLARIAREVPANLG